VLFAQGSFQKDLWIDNLRFQQGIERADSAQREIKNDPVSGSRPEGR
jgi:hypothetical protein